MKNTIKKEKLYISVYFNKILDYVSFSKYGQQYVHMVVITDDPNDRSDRLNGVEIASDKEKGPVPWNRLPAYLRRGWYQVDSIELDETEGLRDFLEESVVLAFQTPKVLWSAVDQTCAYALNANGIEIEPEDVKEHFGHLICFDELELINLSAAFLNGDRDRAEDLSEFMDDVFSDYLKATVNRAVFDFDHHNPIAVG